MIKKIREKFSIAIFQKKLFWAFVLGIIALGVPLVFVDGIAATTAAYTANYLMNVILLAISTISLVFATFTDWFLRLVTVSSEFVNIPYTPAPDGGGNAFVYYGWTVVRDFVNMFFILVLIVIGLATALQIETYRWQKTLPRLILVALLVNFTPDFLGVFIDASNIMMNYFISNVGEESVFVIRMQGLFDVVAQRLSDTIWTSWSGQVVTPAAMVVIFTLFNFFTGFIYLLYGIAFAMRYVAIWLLVIISPFGFFCYILPATQPFFKKWWRWFIGWCIMGVVTAFFLHLGEVMFNADFINQETIMPSSSEHHGMEIGSFVLVFPLIIPLLFLAFGFIVSLFIASLGSKGIIEVFQGASGAARKKSSQLPGSNFREKTKSLASSAVNTFSPGPSAEPLSSQKSSSFGQKAGSEALHRRGGKIESSKGVSHGAKRPINEIVSRANEGAGSATEEIAANISSPEESGFKVEFADDIGKPGSKPPSSESSPKSSPQSSKKSSSETKETKCSDCGASLPEGTATCLLCKKKTPSSFKE